MKKIILGVMLPLVMLCLASCRIHKEASEAPEVVENPIEKIENSKHLISVETAKDLYDNFQTRFRDPIKKIQENVCTVVKKDSTCDVVRKDYEPTKYVLINIDILENYIKLLRAVEKKKGNKKITGVAVFFGANNMDDKVSNKPPFNEKHGEEMACEKRIVESMGGDAVYHNDIRGRVTIFMAPTFRLNDSISKKKDSFISEVQKHVPFYIKRNIGESDPYIGSYMNLLGILDSKAGEKFMTNLKINLKKITLSNSDTTSLILEEFTDMPPREPIITDENKI